MDRQYVPQISDYEHKSPRDESREVFMFLSTSEY